MEGLTLRQAVPEDSELAYSTRKAAFREYVEQVRGWNEEKERQIHEGRFLPQNFRIIDLAGVDVGYMATVVEPGCLKLNQLFILPEYQGRGIGGECMARLLEEARAIGLPVRLRALKVNVRAIAFYERLGFAIVGETGTHFVMACSAAQPG